MKFAEPLPKMKDRGGEGGLLFCSAEEGARESAAAFPAGKLLFVTDAESVSAFCACLPPRGIGMVLDAADALPLFSSSDDVAAVVAAGGEETLRAVRFFAGVRRIPCVLFPSSATLDGVFEERGTVRLCGSARLVPLAGGRVRCDASLMQKSLGRAYLRLVLSRLALIENGALRRFLLPAGEESAEDAAFPALLSLTDQLSAEEIVKRNAAVRRSERAGMRRGEGAALSALCTEEGEAQAYLLLSALYAAFFSKGKPRLFVPDYAARAARAGVPYAQSLIPSPQELAQRAVALERMRASVLRELNLFLRGELAYRRNYYRLTGARFPERVDGTLPDTLAERERGLCSVVRDFGLLERV